MADIRTWALTPENAPAELARQLTHSLLNEGVVDVAGGSYLVLEDTGANMFVRAGSGTAGDRAVIRGDTSARQGSYLAQHQEATVQLPIAAADPSNPRIDLVVVRVFDDEADSSGSSFADVEVLTGTPAGSPVPPAVPDSAIALAEVEVEANATAITNSDITDRRQEAVLRSAIVPELDPLDVAEVTSGTQASLTLTIPAGVSACRIVGQARSDTVADRTPLRGSLNNAVGTNFYIVHHVRHDDAVDGVSVFLNLESSMILGDISAASTVAGIFGSLVADIPTTSGPGKRGVHWSTTVISSASVARTRFGTAYRQALDVTLSTIELFPQSGAFVAGTRFELLRA